MIHLPQGLLSGTPPYDRFKVSDSSTLDRLPNPSMNPFGERARNHCFFIMPCQLLHLPWAFFMFGFILASSSIFSAAEDLDAPDDLDPIDDLDLSPFLYNDYEDIASVPSQSEFPPDDDLFSADLSTACLDDDDVAQPGKLRTRDSCPAPEIPINVPQLPNILPSIQEQHALPPTLLENQDDLAATRSAEDFCSSAKYRLDIRLGRIPVPVCGPSLPLQQGWPGSGADGYYVNVEYSRSSKYACNPSQTPSTLPCHV